MKCNECQVDVAGRSAQTCPLDLEALPCAGDVNQILVSFLGDSGAAPHTDGTDENNVETEAELRGDFEGIERAIANVQSLSDKLDPAVAHLWTADVKHLRAVLRVLRSYMNAGKRECLATEDEVRDVLKAWQYKSPWEFSKLNKVVLAGGVSCFSGNHPESGICHCVPEADGRSQHA